MSRKFTSVIIFLVSIIIIAGIFFFPLEYFRRQDNELIENSHSLGKVSFELDSDVEDIVLLQRIHNVIGSYYSDGELQIPYHTLLLGDDNGDVYITIDDSDDINKAMQSVIGIPSVYELIDKILNVKILSKSIYSKVDDEVDEEYNLIDYSTDSGSVSLIFDRQTDKILQLTLNVNDAELLNGIDKKQLEMDWIEYLNLDIVGDWYYSDDKLISEKAHLELSCVQEDKDLSITFDVN